jgi:hypothetical protein
VGVDVQVSTGLVVVGVGEGLVDSVGLGEGMAIVGDSVARDGDGVGDTWLVAPGPQALRIETTPIAMPIPKRLTYHPTGSAAV